MNTALTLAGVRYPAPRLVKGRCGDACGQWHGATAASLGAHAQMRAVGASARSAAPVPELSEILL